MSEETKIASLEYALELASRDAVEECDRARSAEARVQQLEEALSLVYDHFTRGRISKPNTHPRDVMQVAEELHQEEMVEKDERIQQLAEALRAVQKQAQSFEMYHLDMAKSPDPWMHQIRNIADAALSSEAPEKEEE